MPRGGGTTGTGNAKHVVLVGHCGPDAWFLKSAVNRAIPGAKISMASSFDQVERGLSGADLLLVNRVLDGAFMSESGVDLIRTLRDRDGHGAALMLISNLQEAQEEAEQAGAHRGFGKSQANSDDAEDLLRQAVGLDQ